MKMIGLNDVPELWLRKAKGFKLALELCLKEWNFHVTKSTNLGYKLSDETILMEPMQHITITAIELYLRCFLHSKGLNYGDTYNLMDRGKHNVANLLKKCGEYDARFIDDEVLKYIPLLAGSTKNYSGARYPESGAGASFFDLKLLNKLDFIVREHLKNIESRADSTNFGGQNL